MSERDEAIQGEEQDQEKQWEHFLQNRLDVLGRFAFLIYTAANKEPTLVYLLGFPLLLLLSSIFGTIVVFLAMATLILYHHLQKTNSKRELLHEEFRKYTDSLKAKMETPEWYSVKGGSNRNEVRIANRLLSHWWRFRAEDLADSSLAALQDQMNQNPPNFLKRIQIKGFSIGRQPPRIDAILDCKRERETLTIDFEASYIGDTRISLSITTSLTDTIQFPFRISDIKLIGKFRLEVVFAQKKTFYSISALNDPLLDMAVLPIELIDLSSLPGFAEWIQRTAKESFKRHLRHPTKFIFNESVYAPDLPLANIRETAGTVRSTHKRSKSEPGVLESKSEKIPVEQRITEPSVELRKSPERKEATPGLRSRETEKEKDSIRRKARKAFGIESSPTRTKNLAEALNLFAIDRRVKDYVKQLCQNVDLFLNFPMEASAKGFQMNKRQEKHAILIVEVLPALNAIRYRLSPKQMSEQEFWYVYFSLVKNRTGEILEGTERVEEDWKEVLRHQRAERYQRNLNAELSLFDQMM